MRARVRVPAKINLHLEVLGRRADGYHEVATLLQSVDVFDELEARSAPAEELALEVVPERAVSSGPENLVLRAAERLRELAEGQPGARLRLTKRIPIAAGLGGGSADAAAALAALHTLWGLQVGAATLRELAADVGSDVPFFLEGGFALGTGRGERITALADLPPLGVLIVVDGGPISTAEVYRRLRLTGAGAAANVRRLADRLRAGNGWSEVGNSLEGVVVGGWPRVAAALDALRDTDTLHAAVSGSGAAVFAVFPDRAAAARARLGLAAVGGWIHVGTTLDRSRARLRVETEEAES